MSPRSPLDRFSAVIDSLQEGFDLLSRAPGVKEMGGRLFRLIRGTLTTVDAVVALRPAGGDWEILHGREGGRGAGLEDAGAPAECRLLARSGSPYPLLAVQPLMDGSTLAVALGRKLARGSPYGEEDRIALRIQLQLFATAYQALQQRRREKDLVFSLNHRVLQLTSLIDTGIALSRLDDNDTLFRVALEQAAALTNASRGRVTIRAGRETLRRFDFPAGMRQQRDTPPDQLLRTSFRFSGRTYTFTLAGKESRRGTGAFEETDRLLLESLARQAHAALESQHLHAQEVEKQKIERDIALAASIQQRILPRSLPRIPGYSLAGTNIPTRFVGGDYYDCIPLHDGRYALVIADVAGKGIPAALLVSSFNAYLGAYLESSGSLLDLTRRLNTVIYRASTEERYITAIISLFTPETGALESVNAGHTPMYLRRRDGSLVELSGGGLALGMMDMEFPYETDRAMLERGDSLFLFTDGVSEAMDASGNLYDSNGALREFFLRHGTAVSESFITSLLADLRHFVGPAPQADDITALHLRRHPVDFQDVSQ